MLTAFITLFTFIKSTLNMTILQSTTKWCLTLTVALATLAVALFINIYSGTRLRSLPNSIRARPFAIRNHLQDTLQVFEGLSYCVPATPSGGVRASTAWATAGQKNCAISYEKKLNDVDRASSRDSEETHRDWSRREVL